MLCVTVNATQSLCVSSNVLQRHFIFRSKTLSRRTDKKDQSDDEDRLQISIKKSGENGELIYNKFFVFTHFVLMYVVRDCSLKKRALFLDICLQNNFPIGFFCIFKPDNCLS